MSPIEEVRAYLSGWGSELDDRRVTMAAVAAGVLEANSWLRRTVEVAGEVRSLFETSASPVDWRPPGQALSLIDPDAAFAAMDGLPMIRLWVNTGPGVQDSLYWWVQALGEQPPIDAVVQAEDPPGIPYGAGRCVSGSSTTPNRRPTGTGSPTVFGFRSAADRRPR